MPSISVPLLRHLMVLSVTKRTQDQPGCRQQTPSQISRYCCCPLFCSCSAFYVPSSHWANFLLPGRPMVRINDISSPFWVFQSVELLATSYWDYGISREIWVFIQIRMFKAFIRMKNFKYLWARGVLLGDNVGRRRFLQDIPLKSPHWKPLKTTFWNYW